MKAKLKCLIPIFVIAALVFAGCAQQEKPKATPTPTPAGAKIPKEDGKYVITIYTGSGPGSVYFAVGSMFAKVLNKKSNLIAAKGVTSGASVS
ncbi:C4-dicarboxylate ABC transporter substrate-binding protein, partial [Archaeoglobales archaeon]